MSTNIRPAPPARSLLFVPGNRPERFAKAVASGAHAVIIDLEDAVTPCDKTMAQQAVFDFFAKGGSAMVRVNDLESQWASDDLVLIHRIGSEWGSQLKGVVLPKAEMAADVAKLVRRLPACTPVLPLIETASGMLNARDIAAAPSVLRLLFGSVDFCLDLQIEADGDELSSYRAWLVLVSRAARLEPPVDGVMLSLKDEEALRSATLAAKRIGFGGKFCIHPGQVELVNSCFQPTYEQLAWARRVIERSNTKGSSAGAFELDGRMVDAPVLAQAKHLLEIDSQCARQGMITQSFN
jgi:citrate lyase subunit beta / citryl-CoA lyase